MNPIIMTTGDTGRTCAFDTTTAEYIPSLTDTGDAHLDAPHNATLLLMPPIQIPDGWRLITEEEREGESTGEEKLVLFDLHGSATLTNKDKAIHFSHWCTYIVPPNYKQTQRLEVTVQMNGKKVDPNTISEETWMNLRKGK